MIKLPKAIIKKFGITKRAWAEFRKKREAGKKKAAPKKRSRKRAKKSGTPTQVHTQSGGSKMARRKKRRSVRHHARRTARRISAAVGSRPGQIALMAAEAAAGGVASSMAVNAFAPKDMGRGAKAIAQGAVGMAAILFVRNKHVKSLGAGAVIAAMMGVAKEYLKLEPLAGPSQGSRRLSPSEMQRLTGGMGIPLPGSMGAPVSTAPGNAGFNRGGFGS